MDDLDEAAEPVMTIRTLTDSAAFEIADWIRKNFHTKFRPGEPVRGSLVILGSDGRTLIETPMGAHTPKYQGIAWAKARTAYKMKTDTAELAKSIEEGNLDRANYADLIETLFSGGVLIYEDEACTICVAAAGYSGVPRAEDDEALIAEAADKMGLFTKVPIRVDIDFRHRA